MVGPFWTKPPLSVTIFFNHEDSTSTPFVPAVVSTVRLSVLIHFLPQLRFVLVRMDTTASFANSLRSAPTIVRALSMACVSTACAHVLLVLGRLIAPFLSVPTIVAVLSVAHAVAVIAIAISASGVLIASRTTAL